jgi:diacylglycerol O-acyltransferase / wax synthase
MPSRLSPLDASFLAVETPTAHMHVGWAAAFEPPEGRRPGIAELREHVARRLGRAPRCHQMIRSVPFGINTPVWVDDDRFDVTRQVFRSESRQLGDIVDECMSEPLPRDRPLWQFHIAPRLDDGRIGVVGKAHHCMVDGIAAVELASLLLDPEPDPREPAPEEWTASQAPGAARLLADGVADVVRTELGLLSLPTRAMRAPRRALERATRALGALADAARPASPVTPFNDPISPGRHLGHLARPLEDLLSIKRAFGVKLNDVVLAVSAMGVRRFVQERGEDPSRLKTMVPVNVRGRDEAGALGNRISFMFVDLPCQEPEPTRALYELHGATMERKEAGEPEGADSVMRSLTFAPAPLQRLVSRLVASPRAFNLTVSNIPGPQPPMYMRGCRLAEAYPVVPISDGHGLSIGVTTVGEGAFFGLYADRRTLPDVDRLAETIDESIDEFLAIAAEGVPGPERVLVGG